MSRSYLPQQVAAFIAAERERLGRLIRERNITAQCEPREPAGL